MPVKRLRKPDVAAWLDGLARRMRVYAPRRRGDGVAVLAPWPVEADASGPRAAAPPPVLDYGRLAEGPKRLLFPQSEPLLRWEGAEAEPTLVVEDRVLFGLRACDAAAVGVLDAFFGRDPPDPNYLARRRRTRLVVIACTRSGETCFCASAGTGPVADAGFDLQLLDDGDGYLVEVGSEAGADLLTEVADRLQEVPEARLSERRARLQAEVAGPQPRLDLAEAARSLRGAAGPDAFWEEVARRCLLCGGCAYACPTCTCFTFFDRPDPEAPAGSSRDEASAGAFRGRRVRTWDACVLEGFTREAGGHNPRAAHASRCLRRYEHKLSPPEWSGARWRCVGCGRCAVACPSRLGMVQVLEEWLAATRRGAGDR